MADIRFTYPILFGLTCAPAVAHHSSVIFDENEEFTLDGVVTRFAWRNPHVYIYVGVEDVDGQLIEWQIEAESTPTMIRAGWTSETLAEGERVKIQVHPDRNTDRRHALMISLDKSDDTTLVPERAESPPPIVAATDIFSQWDGSRLLGRYGVSPTLTKKGASALAQFNLTDAPYSQCVPPAPPSVMFTPELIRFSLQEDGHILIQTEDFNVQRIVYMDGRPHPGNGERTNQGHSIGRWEDDVLVIDTTHFADHLTGAWWQGVPSGAQKHLVERFQLIEGGLQLRYDNVLDDPEYLQEPARGGLVLDHAPHETFIPSECDPESAGSWLYE